MRANRTVRIVTSGLLLATLLGGCSSVKSMTCAQFGELSFDKGTNKVTDLIEAHDLDPYSNVVGAAAVVNDVRNFCGISPFEGGPATRNLDQPIDSGVNWSDYGG